MSVPTAKIVVFPKVTEDGALEFDSSGAIPEILPLFVKRGNKFYPIFEPCKYRSTVERPATNKPG